MKGPVELEEDPTPTPAVGEGPKGDRLTLGVVWVAENGQEPGWSGDH